MEYFTDFALDFESQIRLVKEEKESFFELASCYEPGSAPHVSLSEKAKIYHSIEQNLYALMLMAPQLLSIKCKRTKDCANEKS